MTNVSLQINKFTSSNIEIVSYTDSLGYQDPGGSDSKESPAMQETWVQFLGWEDPLEEGVATHSSILAWRILMNREAWWTTVPWVAKSWT